MRIDLVARRLGAGGGSEGVGLGLARHLLEAGDRVVAHCLEPGEAVPGLEHRRLPGPPVRGGWPGSFGWPGLRGPRRRSPRCCAWG